MKKTITRLLLILLLLAAMPALLSCKSSPDSPAENTVTFTDALGRQVSVPAEPQRTAALIGSFADVWVLSGGSLCAAPEETWLDYQLNLPDAVNIGGAHSPSLELLLSADPQFVIASASTASNVDMLEVLEAAGITVAYFDVDHFEDYLNMLKKYSNISRMVQMRTY